MKRSRYIYLCLYIATLVFICFSSLQNGEASGNLSGGITNVICSILETALKIDIDESIMSLLVRKLIGHFGSYFLLGLWGIMYFVQLVKPTKGLIMSLSFGLVFSIIGELLQLLSDGRNCNVYDMMIDFSGVAISSLLIYLFIKRTDRRD